jgi:hypothetical protein
MKVLVIVQANERWSNLHYSLIGVAWQVLFPILNLQVEPAVGAALLAWNFLMKESTENCHSWPVCFRLLNVRLTVQIYTGRFLENKFSSVKFLCAFCRIKFIKIVKRNENQLLGHDIVRPFITLSFHMIWKHISLLPIRSIYKLQNR